MTQIHSGQLPDCNTFPQSDKDIDSIPYATEHSTTSRKPFRFLDLPQELRAHILSYTDLVTPKREVTFTPSRGYHLISSPHPRYSTNRSQTLFAQHLNKAGLPPFPRKPTVTQSYRPKDDWNPPTSLFLVSRLFHALATQLFFSHNRFIVLPDNHLAYEPHPSHLSIPRTVSAFLERLAPGSLRYLRQLEIVFRPVHGPFFALDSEEGRQWSSVVGKLRAECHLPGLTIRLYLPDMTSLYDGAVFTSGRKEWSSSDRETTATGCEEVVKGMVGLAGLRDIFVHAAWNQGYNHWWREGEVEKLKVLGERERRLERMVMGDEYESYEERKRRRPSGWLRRTKDGW